MNRMHPEAEQRDDCTLYVRIFFCHSNILPKDDHFSQKDDSFEEILKQLPAGNDNVIVLSNN